MMEISVKLDEALSKRLAARAESLGFGSPEAYVKDLIDKALEEGGESAEDRIAKKLEDLGYM